MLSDSDIHLVQFALRYLEANLGESLSAINRERQKPVTATQIKKELSELTKQFKKQNLYVVWGSSEIDGWEDMNPEKISMTSAEMSVFLDAIEGAEGYDSIATFETRKEAKEHMSEQLDDYEDEDEFEDEE